MAHIRTDDTRIEQSDELLAPMQIMRELKASPMTAWSSWSAPVQFTIPPPPSNTPAS